MSASEINRLAQQVINKYSKMIIPIDTYTTRYAGQILYWHGTDSEQLWQSHMNDLDRRQQLIDSGYDSQLSISYRFNSHGFRSAEFDQSPCMIALGCSFTSGVGLREDQIWCHLLSQQLGLRLVNLGVGGASLDTCTRLLYHWLPQFDAKLVCVLEPPCYRFEMVVVGDDTKYTKVFAPNYCNTPYESMVKVYYSSDQNSNINVWKNRMAIQHICDLARVPLISVDVENGLLGYRDDKKWPGARDLSHPGVTSHQKCANHFHNLIELKKS